MMRFYCGVLHLSHVWHTFLLECFAFGSRLLFAAKRQTGRLAVSCVSIPPGRDRHSCVLAALFGYLPLWVHFGFVRFFMAISTGYRDAGNEERGWRQGASGSLRRRIGIEMLSAGSTLGLRAPNLRQRVFDSLDSPHAAAGLGWCKFAAPSLGHTERPARL